MTRIGLEITMLNRPRTGVENYIASLAAALPSAARDMEFFYFSCQPIPDRFDGARVIIEPSNSYARWRQTALPRLAREHRLDLIHCPITAVPLRSAAPVVSTIQDVIWSRYPEMYSIRRRIAHRVWCALSVRKARRVIVPSEATAQELTRLHPRIVRDKMAVIPDCIPPMKAHERAGGDAAVVLDRLRIRPPFLFTVGTIQPRKNYERLITAFERMRQAGLPPHQLVIVGRDGFAAERVHRAAHASPFASDIRILGYLPNEEIAALYRSASLLVYPSIYEGFGIPLLEAMRWGTPVASSNSSSMPEVGGDAAVYFDPYSVEDMSQALCRALTNQSLRAELVRKGQARVKLFTPEIMAARTVALYRRVLESR